MKRLILAALVLTTPAWAVAPADDLPVLADQMQRDALMLLHPDIVNLCSDWQTSGGCNIVIGIDAGLSLSANAAGNILVGNGVDVPDPNAKGFVNIANTLCFWRTTGERVSCPKIGD